MYGRRSRIGVAKAFDQYLQTGRKWWRVLDSSDADTRPIQLERYCSRCWYGPPLLILLKHLENHADDLIFAALRGLEGAIVTKRRCRRHYGTALARPFQPESEPNDSLVYHDPLTDKLWRKGWMSWSIKKVTETEHPSGS